MHMVVPDPISGAYLDWWLVATTKVDQCFKYDIQHGNADNLLLPCITSFNILNTNHLFNK